MLCPNSVRNCRYGLNVLASDAAIVYSVFLFIEIITFSYLCRNELERQFLEMLQFNINVPSSVYAKYYFDLRALADAHDLSFPLEPLSKERAAKLEVMSELITCSFVYHCFKCHLIFRKLRQK